MWQWREVGDVKGSVKIICARRDDSDAVGCWYLDTAKDGTVGLSETVVGSGDWCPVCRVLGVLGVVCNGCWVWWVLGVLGVGCDGCWVCWVLGVMGVGCDGCWVWWVLGVMGIGCDGCWVWWVLSVLGWLIEHGVEIRRRTHESRVLQRTCEDWDYIDYI